MAILNTNGVPEDFVLPSSVLEDKDFMFPLFHAFADVVREMMLRIVIPFQDYNCMDDKYINVFLDIYNLQFLRKYPDLVPNNKIKAILNLMPYLLITAGSRACFKKIFEIIMDIYDDSILSIVYYLDGAKTHDGTFALGETVKTSLPFKIDYGTFIIQVDVENKYYDLVFDILTYFKPLNCSIVKKI